MEEERRHHQRKQMMLEVRSDDFGQSGLRTTDISVGGCYIETMAQVAVGDSLAFEIRLPGGQWVPLQGTVVYHHPTVGFGLRFTGLTQEHKDILSRLVESFDS